MPERFLDPNWNRDAFIAFAVGPRSCIGRRYVSLNNVRLPSSTNDVVLQICRIYSICLLSSNGTQVSYLDRREQIQDHPRRISSRPSSTVLAPKAYIIARTSNAPPGLHAPRLNFDRVLVYVVSNVV